MFCFMINARTATYTHNSPFHVSLRCLSVRYKYTIFLDLFQHHFKQKKCQIKKWHSKKRYKVENRPIIA